MLKWLAGFLLISSTALAAYSPGTYLTDSTGAYIDPRARTWSLGVGDSVTVNTISGFSTETSLLGVRTDLSSILAKMPTLVSGNVPISGAVSVSNFPSSFSISNFPSTQAVTGAFFQTTQPVSIAATVPVSFAGGVAVNNFPATQAVSGTVTANVAGGNTTAVKVDGSAVTQPVSGSVSVSNFPGTQAVSGTVAVSNMVAQGLTDTQLRASAVGVSGSVGVTSLPALPAGSNAIGSVSVSNFPSTQAVSAASLPLPAGAATDATLTTMSAKIPPLGQALSAASQPVTLASDQSPIIVSSPDLTLIGGAAQTALVNNILPATPGTAANDVTGYRSGSVQIVSTGTAGGFILEGSNDNVNFQTVQWYSQLSPGAPIVTAVVPTASQLIYTFPIKTRYLRLRISTAVTGGTIQAFSRFSQESWSPAVNTVAVSGNVAATLNAGTNAVGAVNLITTAATDIVSAAITTTATSAAVTLTNLQAQSWVFAVTAVSGTTPTLDISIQESLDNVNWFDAYHCERITAVSTCVVPLMRLNGLYIRYVRTITGTTPSFTMSAIRLSKPVQAPLIRRIFDRTIVPNTLNSVTPVLFTDGCETVQLTQSAGAGATTNPVYTLEGSENNIDWYALGAASVTAAPSTNSTTTATGQLMKFARARISTAGAAATQNYVSLKCKGA